VSGNVVCCFDHFYLSVCDLPRFTCLATAEISTFEKTVESLVDILSAQAEKIERQKLMAIGLRNKVESEAENRKRKQQEIVADINQKKIELDR
jgi:intraflagellar transport protein 20